MSYALPQVVDETLDGSFTIAELKYLVVRVKKRKAPGVDKVPYGEFFKYAPDGLLNNVLKTYF